MTGKTLDYHKTYPNLPWHVAEQLQLQMQALWAVEAIRDHLEAQQETPASAETTSSLQATAPTADGQSGSSTSFEWSCPAKAATGEPAITATVTFPVPNLLLTVGDLQRLVQEGNWIRLSPMTSEQLSRFGATPSTTPVEEVAGPSAGGAGPSPDSPASSPEPAQGGSEGCKYQWWHKGEYYTCNYPVVQDDRCRLHLGKEEGSERG